MSEERIQEIKDSINFQYELIVSKGIDKSALLFTDEEQELLEEVERLNNIINKSVEAINTYQDSKTFGINYENIRTIRGILKGNEFDIRIFEEYLKELKEGKRSEK